MQLRADGLRGVGDLAVAGEQASQRRNKPPDHARRSTCTVVTVPRCGARGRDATLCVELVSASVRPIAHKVPAGPEPAQRGAVHGRVLSTQRPGWKRQTLANADEGPAVIRACMRPSVLATRYGRVRRVFGFCSHASYPNIVRTSRRTPDFPGIPAESFPRAASRRRPAGGRARPGERAGVTRTPYLG